MASDELVDLENDLERIRTARREIAGRLEFEHDPDKRDDYELRLKDCQSLEQFFLARIFRCREAREIRDLEYAPTSVFQLLFEQDRKKRLEWLRTRQIALDAAILRYKSRHPRWIETLYRVLPGFKPDEILKKPAAESVQVGDPVPTSMVPEQASPEPSQEQGKPVLQKPAGDLSPTPGNVLIDKDVLLALIGQMTPKTTPAEPDGARTPPAARDQKQRDVPASQKKKPKPKPASPPVEMPVSAPPPVTNPATDAAAKVSQPPAPRQSIEEVERKTRSGSPPSRRYKKIYSIIIKKKLNQRLYAIALDKAGIKPPAQWIDNGYPPTYLEIYDAHEEGKDRIRKERSRVKKRVEKYSPPSTKLTKS